jgi:hypothetical protein
MKTSKEKKPKLISSPFTSLGITFSPGNPSLVTAAGYDVARLSEKLRKVFFLVEKHGSAGMKVKDLDRYRRWNARFLLKIHALREVPDREAGKAGKKKAGPRRKPAKAAGKAASRTNPLAKAA